MSRISLFVFNLGKLCLFVNLHLEMHMIIDKVQNVGNMELAKMVGGLLWLNSCFNPSSLVLGLYNSYIRALIVQKQF